MDGEFVEEASEIKWFINTKYKPHLSKVRLVITIFICLIIIFGLVFGQIILGSLIQYWEYSLVIILVPMIVYGIGIFLIPYLFSLLLPQKIGFSQDSLHLYYGNKSNTIRWKDIIDIEGNLKDKKVLNPAYYIITKTGKEYRLGRTGIGIEKKIMEEIFQDYKKYKSNP